jgi:hypothetical protein
MTPDNCLLVNHELVEVGPGDYPFGDGQVWADPDIGHATELLESILIDREKAREIAARGRRDVRLGHGYRAVGLRIMAQVNEIKARLARKAARPKRAKRTLRGEVSPVP